jgi:hypothetical protein
VPHGHTLRKSRSISIWIFISPLDLSHSRKSRSAFSLFDRRGSPGRLSPRDLPRRCDPRETQSGCSRLKVRLQAKPTNDFKILSLSRPAKDEDDSSLSALLCALPEAAIFATSAENAVLHHEMPSPSQDSVGNTEPSRQPQKSPCL